MIKLILLLVVFLNFISSILVVGREDNTTSNRLFCLVSFSASIWTFANYMTGTLRSPVWLEATYASSVLLIVTGLFWVLHTARGAVGHRTLWSVLISSGVLIVALFLPSFIAQNYSEIYLGGVFTGEAGVGLLIYGVFMCTVFVVMAYVLGVAFYRAQNSKKRLQLEYTFFGIISVVLLVIFTNILLPMFSIFNLSAVPSIAFPLFLVCVGYSIIRGEGIHVKIIATELTILSLWAFLLIHVFALDTKSDRVIGVLLLLISIIVGWQLRQSVRVEVEQKDALEAAAEALRFANAEIAEANSKLSALSEFKSELLSFATHQLRSPLASIAGYASMLSDGSAGRMSARQKEIVSSVNEAVAHLSTTVEEFLSVSKIDQGGLTYDMRPFNFVDLVRASIKECSGVVHVKGLVMEFHSPLHPVVVFADREKIRQVVQNIFDNAIKYTREGRVLVSVSVERPNVVLLEVSDTGIGIPAEEIENIFDKFKRTRGGARAANGSGLGLYLAKQIIEAHGGSIWASSAGRGSGSVFRLRLVRNEDGVDI